MKCNGYFTFQTIIDITEARGIISFFGMWGSQRCYSNSSRFEMLCNRLNIARNVLIFPAKFLENTLVKAKSKMLEK